MVGGRGRDDRVWDGGGQARRGGMVALRVGIEIVRFFGDEGGIFAISATELGQASVQLVLRMFCCVVDHSFYS